MTNHSTIDPPNLKTIAILERRLTDGWTRIEAARKRGDNVTAWEAVLD